jgi:glycosyltransferase involved in cell wall biosynthesis
MRTAIVTTVLSHFEVPLFRIAAGLDGLDVRVFHTDPSDDSFQDKDYRTTIDWGEKLRAGYPNDFFKDIPSLERAVFRWQPDVIMQYGYFWGGAFGFLAKARLRLIPVVHRGLLTPYHNTRESALLVAGWRKLQPYFLRQFSAHHYGGSYSEEVLDRAGVPKHRRYFVPYSIDTPYFAARADDATEAEKAFVLRRELGWTPDDPVLLFMCQHSYFKAPDVMIRIAAEAQKRLPAIKLIMAGSGSMTAEIRAEAERTLAPGSFAFPGFVSSKQTMPYYLAADLVMFPSRYDTWSRGVNEAMLARRPCLVSRVVPAAGGLVEHGENGFVADGVEPGPFVALIKEFFALPRRQRNAMGEAARERAQFFSYEAHKDELYRSLTEVAR